jgi:hypothetical protein
MADHGDGDDDRDLDRYEAFYTQKLWNLLPAIYRAEDSTDVDRQGPLAELVARVGTQAAILRRSIDRLWEDQSIETCDDWVIAYLGDLLATNLVAGMDARGQRLDVAKTIHYRRRKGTVPLLEELGTDITGWSTRVVEFFRRLARTRHLLDPAIGLPVAHTHPHFRLQRVEGLIGPHTLTAAGGLADLRSRQGAAMTSTAFDEYFHTADIRRGRGMNGWHDIPHLGVFVWRLRTQLVRKVTPVKDGRCDLTFTQFTFDPTGRDIPLFAMGEHTFGDEWVSPQVQQMPGPLTNALMSVAFEHLYSRSLGLAYPPTPDYMPVAAKDIERDARRIDTKPWIDVERGRVFWRGPPTDPDFRVDYHYGFSAEIGAGPYDRPVLDADGLTRRLVRLDRTPPDSIAAGHTTLVVLDKSLTHTRVDPFTVRRVVLQAQSQERPLIRPAVPEWIFTGTGNAELTFDGIWVSGGCDLVLAGSFDKVTLSCCTLDPGSWDAEKAQWKPAADGRPLAATRLRIAGRVRELVIDRSITGPLLAEGPSGRVGSLTIRESIVQAAKPGVEAITLPNGEVMLSRCTLLGTAAVHRLHASECILNDVVAVIDRQHGCVRFSAWSEGSELPRQYESIGLPPRAFLFASLDIGQPAYAQLLDTAGGKIAQGAEDGSEMGAFWREKNALKERGLLIKYQEYLPLGIEPVVVHVT